GAGPRARAGAEPRRQRSASMSFARPLLLVLLAALPLWWWWRRQRLSRQQGAPMSDVRPTMGPVQRLWIARLPVTLRSLCLAAWIIAAAGPRRTATDFVRARSSDRIGLVAFAGEALTQVPITTDYEVLEEAIRQMRVGILEDGTAIGTAIATAANRLRRAPGKSKVVVLLTDGEN